MFKDLVLQNRSYRGYDRSRAVSREELVEMVDCARQTAASMNVQPLKYYIVSDEAEVALVNSMIKMGGSLPQLGLPFKGTEPPAFILVCYDYEVQPNKAEIFMIDVGITSQTIALAATEMGFGCCMIGSHNKDKLREALGLPERYRIELVLAIGKGCEDIELVEVENGESMKYYRDEAGKHYVPKRKLADVIIEK